MCWDKSMVITMAPTLVSCHSSQASVHRLNKKADAYPSHMVLTHTCILGDVLPMGHIKSHHTWKPLHHHCSPDDSQHMDTCHAFSNHVKETLNHGLSLSEVDWSDPKGESTKHGPSLVEVNWAGKIEPYHTTNVCMLSEVDWGAHDSSFFLYLKLVDHDGEPKDIFKILWILEKLKVDFSTSNQSRNREVHISS